MDIFVIKRNGHREKYSPDKINRLLDWAVEGYDALAMDIAMQTQFNLYDGIPTKEVHQALAVAATGMIGLETPDYQYVAAKLMLAGLRKEVWGETVPPGFAYFIHQNHELGFYADWTVNDFTNAEIEELDAYLDHDRDFLLTAAAVRQIQDKYLLQDRVEKRYFETPQFAYMLIAMGLYRRCPNRLSWIKRAYDHYTLQRINLPTPLLAGMRSKINSYASCALVEVGDSLSSIMESLTNCATAVSMRYGLGLDFSNVRAIGSPIRGGEAIHSGVIGMLKIFETTIRGLYQGGVRRGSATVHFNWWHYEMPEILMLKAVDGAEEQRVRHLDYSINFERTFFERALADQEVTLFSPHEVPELLATTGLPEFKALYEAAEANPAIRMKRKVRAVELLQTYLVQRFNTARFYAFFADNVNRHVPWKALIRMSNLCQEILTPTVPAYYPNDPDAEHGICVLSAVNVVNTPLELMDDVCETIVMGLDQMIDLQDYFSPGARAFCTKRRSLGVGITNLAALFASEGLNYDSPEAPNRAAQIMESVQFHLIKASMNLAKEYGRCEKFHETKWADGVLPIDTYRKSIDAFVTEPLHYDWEWLRGEIAVHGMRHSTLTAIMPVESSSVVQNATNGIEPPKTLMIAKSSRAGHASFLVPGVGKYHQNYKLAFEYTDNLGYLRVAAALQKFTCMSISSNAYYNPAQFPDGKVPVDVLLKEFLAAWKYGLHTLYYLNTDDGDDQSVDKGESSTKCDAGGCML